jgi:hypothetical protein
LDRNIHDCNSPNLSVNKKRYFAGPQSRCSRLVTVDDMMAGSDKGHCRQDMPLVYYAGVDSASRD